MENTNVGQTLRSAREQQGFSLADVAVRTKIPIHVLDAIERDALDEVAGGLFTRGYLRAIAAEVGVDGESLVQQHVDRHSELDAVEQLRARFRPVEIGRHGHVLYIAAIMLLGLLLILHQTVQLVAG